MEKLTNHKDENVPPTNHQSFLPSPPSVHRNYLSSQEVDQHNNQSTDTHQQQQGVELANYSHSYYNDSNEVAENCTGIDGDDDAYHSQDDVDAADYFLGMH